MSGDLELVRSIQRLRQTIKQMKTVATTAAQNLPDAPHEVHDEWREMLLDFSDCLTELKALDTDPPPGIETEWPDWAYDRDPFRTRH